MRNDVQGVRACSAHGAGAGSARRRNRPIHEGHALGSFPTDSAMRVAVVDYGMGNLHSVSKAVEHVAPHARVEVTSDPARVAGADRVVFPGQGAMPDCMREMDARGLREVVLDAAYGKPFLGICIGLQMLFERSEEGDIAGLGVLPGKVRRFPAAGIFDANGS